jgi:hypothetical protein
VGSRRMWDAGYGGVAAAVEGRGGAPWMMGGIVDDSDGCGRSLLFVDDGQIERRQTPTLDLGLGRQQHDLARSVYVHTMVA